MALASGQNIIIVTDAAGRRTPVQVTLASATGQSCVAVTTADGRRVLVRASIADATGQQVVEATTADGRRVLIKFDNCDANLLLHFDADTPFVDSSGNSHTMSKSGSVSSQSTFAKFSDAIDFTGGGTVSTPDHDALRLGTGDFTIHAWIRPKMSASQNSTIVQKGYIVSGTTGGFSFRFGNTGLQPFNESLHFASYVDGSGYVFFAHGPQGIITDDVWQHVAVVRQAADTRIFLDGVSQTLTWTTGSPSQTDADHDISGGTAELVVGRKTVGAGGDAEQIDGYMDELVIWPSALWWANFTPPTAPTC